MKFLCDNCKAKYQISDDKVAGKTVRMKCRKCGHQIEVRAAVTETSVSVAPPKPDVPNAPHGPGPAAGAPKRPGLATSLSATRPQTQKMSRPEPGGLAGAFNKAVKDEHAAAAHGHAPASARPYSSQPPSNLDSLDVSMTEEWYVAINGVPVGPIRVSELRRKAAGGAIHDDSLCWQEGLEEWRPVKAIPELARIVREAAMSGRPSLTGNSERPSQTPAPPTAGTGTLVPSSQPHAHQPHGGPPPQAPRTPARPGPATGGPMSPMSPMMGGGQMGAPRPLQTGAPMQVAAHAAPGGSPFGIAGLQQQPHMPPARNNVVPISAGRLATAERLEDPVPAAVLFAPPAPTAPTPHPPVVLDPFGATAPAAPSPYSNMPMAPPPGMQMQGGQMMVATASPSFAPPAPQKRGAPLWAIAAIVFAGCFGIAVAVMVFMPKAPPAQPVAAQTGTAPTTQPSVDPSAALAGVGAPPSTSAAPDPSSSTGGSGKIASSGPRSSGAVASGPASAHTNPDLKSLLGSGPGGPNDAPGPGGAAAGGAGTGLDGNAVQKVVRDRQQGVRRKCWDTGSNDQKTSANVQVVVTVAPNGSVTNAAATGDEPIASCIGREVKTWTFPAPGSTTTVNIPFHFVRQ